MFTDDHNLPRIQVINFTKVRNYKTKLKAEKA